MAALLAASLAGLAGCGGSQQQGEPVAPPPPVTPEPPVTPPVPPPITPPVEPPVPPVRPPPVTAIEVMDRCVAPRAGGFYPDRQGTLSDELDFLRLYTDETYLWYKEVPKDLQQASYTDPLAYFQDLKTPLLTASGQPKDKYHFTYTSAEWDDIEQGVDLGYGVQWVRSSGSGSVPRVWHVAGVTPGTAAAFAGLQRGDRLIGLDGLDFVNAIGADNVARLNAALFPAAAGEPHRYVVERGERQLDAVMVASRVFTSPVPLAKVLSNGSGKVGYLLFNEHTGAAENQLIKAFTQFQSASVSDLVIDLRYNGGGLVLVASELAYMVAGPVQTAGKFFERPVGSDRIAPRQPTAFRSKAIGFSSPDPAKSGTELPYLGLKRVTMLTGPGTCSASEMLINSLRGVDVDVNIIGGATCGKPYSFSPAPNCGITYFMVQYQSYNHKGQSDYADGFAPTCPAHDDLSRALGDPAEAQLSTALQYLASGSCTLVPVRARAAAVLVPAMTPVRTQGREIAVQPAAR